MSFGRVYDIIVSALVTEKTNLQMADNKIVLEVLTSATKNDVKKAVETVFGFEVEKVNIATVAGKVKKFKGVEGCRGPKKKAVVSFKKGQQLDLTKLEVK
ncbi:MAG: 50S ribosomal protein L23 [Rickettsiales bacterium]|jgi:large subunit ribosomal protein L23|nr:50S ribosomal protein L23 [Rickettsiales bacterium]